MSMDIDLKLFPKWLRTMLTTSILSMDKIQNPTETSTGPSAESQRSADVYMISWGKKEKL